MIQIIENIVCNAMKTNYLNVHSKSRQRQIKDTRQIVMFLVRERYPKKPLAQIAGFYGMTHATCIHAIKTIRNLIETDSSFRLNIEFMRLEIEAELSEGLLEKVIDERNSIQRIVDKYLIKLKGLNEIIDKLENVKKPDKNQATAVEIVDDFKIVNNFKSPFKELDPVNGKPYSGYRQHSL
jgi:hypothetical protein